jgi:putative aldouronate transport system substrate-binding protein
MLKNENLIDPDAFVQGQNYPPFADKLRADNDGIVGAVGVWMMNDYFYNPKVRAQYEYMPQLQGPKGKAGFVLSYSEALNVNSAIITSDCKYPEVIAAFVNYCYEPDISIQLAQGAEGMVIYKDNKGLWRSYTDENGDALVKEPFKSYNDMRINSSPFDGPYINLNEYWDTLQEYDINANLVLTGQLACGKEELLSRLTVIPMMIYTTAEQRVISRIYPVAADIVKRYRLQWIMDGNADATWDKYISELKAAGVDDLVKAVQSAYDRYLQAMK